MRSPIRPRDLPAVRRTAAAVLAAGAMLVSTAGTALALDPGKLEGHLSLGYSQLFVSDSPGGSLSVAAGADYPLADRLRFGAGIGFALLGSRALESGTAVANLDYSAFDASAMLYWIPDGWGPIGRIGVGPALVSARAELSTSGGGIAFTPEAIEEVAPALAVDVTLMSTRPSLVRAGFELGVRHAFVEDEAWTIGSIRLAIHY